MDQPELKGLRDLRDRWVSKVYKGPPVQVNVFAAQPKTVTQLPSTFTTLLSLSLPAGPFVVFANVAGFLHTTGALAGSMDCELNRSNGLLLGFLPTILAPSMPGYVSLNVYGVLQSLDTITLDCEGSPPAGDSISAFATLTAIQVGSLTQQ